MKKEAEENIVTLYYRKAENIPETGDQEETAKIAVKLRRRESRCFCCWRSERKLSAYACSA